MSRAFFIRLCLLCAAMTLPLWGILAVKWPISSDFICYTTFLRSFSAQFWSGDAYPRWLININNGYGSPVFLFYPPVSFYIISLFEFLAPLDPYGFGRGLIGIMLSILVAGVASYRWLRQTLPVETAEKGALLYAGFPYLLLHMYGGFAVAQLWGIALLPLLLEAAGDMAKTGWRAMPKMILTYTLLCCTHLPSSVIFVAVPCLYVPVFATNRRLLKALLAGISALLGIALAGIYLFPAIYNKPYITTEHLLDGNLVYANNFLDTYSQLGLLCMVLPLIVLYCELPRYSRRAALTKPVRFWIAVLALFLFMALPLSEPIWAALPPLQHLQFPFRFILAMLPGSVYIALHFLPQARSRNVYRMLFVIGLVSATVYSEEIAFFPHFSPVAAILEHNLLARPEYQTRWMEKQNIDFRIAVPETFLDRKPVTFITGSGAAAITGQNSRSLWLHADIASPEAKITLQRFYFPGWQSTSPGIAVSEYKSLLALTLPEGSHDVRLDVPWFPGEREGMIASLAALILLLGIFAFTRLQAPGNSHITEP